jgi:hypothetical protein
VIRRLLAIVVALLMLNVSVAEALRVCASEATHEAPIAAEHAEHQHHSAPAEPTEDDEAPADPASCCAAMTSCGISLALDGAADEQRISPDRDPVIALTATAPSALERSPEPPPPKGQA